MTKDLLFESASAPAYQFPTQNKVIDYKQEL